MAEPSQPRSRDITVGPAPTYKGTTLYTNSWALVVGINRYEDERIPALQFAERDAQDIASLLPSLGFPSNNIYMRLGSRKEVSRDLILEVLEEDLNPRMERDDRLLLYFAGHGVITKVHEEQRGYLLLPNSKVFGEWPTRERPYLTRPPAPALEMTTLLNTVRGLPAKHKLVLVDSCFSGFMARDLEVRQVKTNDPRLVQWTREPVTQVLTAGRSGQQSRELAIYGHGVFSWYVLKGLQGNADLRGDGLIAFSDLVSFVRDRVAKEPDVDQDPQPGRFGEGEFVFVYEPPPREPPVKEPPLEIKKRPPTGSIEVRSEVAGHLLLDGKRLGERVEPKEVVELGDIPVGWHEVAVQGESGTVSQTVLVRENETTGVHLRVAAPVKRTSPWAYWTAGGLMVLILLIGGLWYHSQQQAEEARRLAGLLAQAQQQMAGGRLITPAGDNALETYRKVLREVPGHKKALEGIEGIVSSN